MEKLEKNIVPSWNDVKKHISCYNEKQLTNLVGDLYRLASINKDFFHTRFELGEDPLSSYKKTIQHSLNPDPENKEDLDIERASDALNRYSKAVDNPIGEADLLTYYVECGNSFTLSNGDIDEGFYNALLEAYEDATETVLELSDSNQKSFKNRLFEIMQSASGIGGGYYDGLCSLYHGAFPDKTKQQTNT